MNYPSITALTCTGGRPDAFNLCRRWMSNQTRQPDEWIVVDDVEEETPVTSKETVIRPTPFWTPELGHTLKRNMLAGLERVKTDIVVIIEDDDYYAPEWLEYVEDTFINYPDIEIVGECRTVYYNVSVMLSRKCSNVFHASLCSTAFRRSVIQEVMTIIEACEDCYVDIPIWRALYDRGLLLNSEHVIGIKGLPGRHGIGTGHNWPISHRNNDYTLERLKGYVGDDYKYYLPYVNHTLIESASAVQPIVPDIPEYCERSIANPPNMRYGA